MMNKQEQEELQATYARWTDQDLLKALTTDRSQYRQDVIPLIESEVRSRKIEVPPAPLPATANTPVDQMPPKPPLGMRFLRLLSLLLLIFSAVGIANAITAGILPDKQIGVIAAAGIVALILFAGSLLLGRYVSARVAMFRESATPRSHDIWLIAIIIACVLSWIAVLAALPELLAWPAVFLTIAAAAIPFKERRIRLRTHLVAVVAIVSTSLLVNYPGMFLGMATKHAEARSKDFSPIVDACTQHTTDANFRSAITDPRSIAIDRIRPAGVLMVEAQGDKEPFRCRVSSWDSFVPQSDRPQGMSDVSLVALIGPRIGVSPRLGPFDQSDVTVAIPVLLYRWPDMSEVGHLKLSTTMVVRKTGSVLALYWRAFRRETSLADQLRVALTKSPNG